MEFAKEFESCPVSQCREGVKQWRKEMEVEKLQREARREGENGGRERCERNVDEIAENI